MTRLKKYRRAISPVVTTLFLFGVILGAISVTLALIYPQLQSLNDQIQLETAGSSMQSLDSNIQNLIINGEGSKFVTEIKMGNSGFFTYNNQIYATLALFQTGLINPISQFGVNHSRLQMFQPLSTDYLDEGEYQYFGGAGDQSYLYLNSLTRSLLSWSFINQSRPLDSDEVSTALSYRNIVTSESMIIPQKLQFNVTVQVQMVNITLGGGSQLSKSGAKVALDVTYVGTTSRYSDWVKNVGDDVTLRATIQFPEAGSSNSVETPFFVEKPSDPSSLFNIRFEFVYHQIEVVIF